MVGARCIWGRSGQRDDPGLVGSPRQDLVKIWFFILKGDRKWVEREWRVLRLHPGSLEQTERGQEWVQGGDLFRKLLQLSREEMIVRCRQRWGEMELDLGREGEERPRLSETVHESMAALRHEAAQGWV